MGKKSAKRVTNFLGTSAMTRPLFMLGAASVLLGTGPAHALDANTLPQNPNVVGGKDSFSQSGNTLNVNQSTNRTVIDWRSFDIGSKAQVNFAQPGTSSIAVNRVNSSANPTQIEGGLHANGQVWILNPNGVFFSKTAHVDAAGIVASTANIDANAFMAGSNKLQMTGADHGSVENQGNISVGANGLAAFVAPSVRNSGTINATVGRVALAAGTTYTLDLAGDHLVELGLGSVKAVVDSSGKIVNPGGTIALTAKAAGQVVNSVVNVSGVVSASSVTKSGGTITLGGDTINTTATAQLSADAGTNGNGGSITSVANVQGNYAGSFSAKGGSQSGNGGKVETSGHGNVSVDPSLKVDTSASNGITGTWLIDPATLTIDSSNVGTYESQLNTSNVDLTADTSITLNAAFDTSSQTNSNTLNFKDGNADNLLTVNLNAPITLASTQHLTGDANIVNVAGALGGLIQNGIDVARSSGGATINVGAAIYAETLNITKNVDIEGAGVGQTIIQPTALLDSHIGHKYTADAQVTVLVNGASGVTLNNLTINGNDLGNDAVVLWNNSSGSITNSLIENAQTFDGLQTGQGLGVDGSTGNTDNLTVDNVTFLNFNKNAINAVNGNSNTTGGGDINLTVKNSFITGAGNTNTNAQNGIVTWERGGGTINATIDNVSFSDLSFSDPSVATAAGVLQYGSANGTVTVKNSTFNNVQEYVSSAGDPASGYSKHEIDATVGNTFDGVAASGATLDQLYTIEKKIIDGTDDGVDGLVRLVAGHVYATASKDNIQNAVDVASSGDTINVQAGTYADSVYINKSVTLLGANGGVNAANGGGAAPATRGAETILSHNGLSALTIDANNVTVDGFEFTGGNGRLIDWASASNIDGLTIKNNIFNLPSGPQNGGVIQLSGTGTAKNIDIANNLFEGNAFAASGDISSTWVYVGGTATNGFSGLTLSGNDFTGGADNAVFQGVPTFDGLSVTDNYFSGSHGLIEGLNMGSLDNPTISGNQFVGVVDTGMQIGTTNGGLIENNTFDGTGSGYVSGGVRYASGMEVWGGQYGTASSNGLTITGNTFKNFVDASPLSASDRVAAIYLRPADSGPGGAGPLSITNNTIENNTVGLLANTSVTGSTVTSNTFTDNATQVRDLQGAFNLATLAASNTLDADVWITGGNSLFGNIQAGVDASVNGDTVNIGTGTYNESVTIDDNISLVGESAAGRAKITGGILMSGALSDITLKNLDVSGTVSGNAADFVIKDSGTLNNFTMDHVLVDGENVAGRFGVGNGQISGAISITNSEFDNISGWVVFDNRAGAGGTVGVNDGTLLASVNFSNNIVNNSHGSIAFRQLGNGGPYADITISGNTVENVGNATNSFGGIFKVFNAGNVTFSGNNISGIGTSGFNPAGEAAYGAALLTRGVNTLNVTNNTFTNNNMAFAVEPGKALPGTVNFSGNTFDNNKYSIYLPTNVSGSGTINFAGTNNFIAGSDTVKDIVWTSSSALDLTGVQFNGQTGAQMSDANLFATEDLITDGLDNTAYGLARLKVGNVYVTAASGSIANGVTKASVGDTVNVQAGNYTLSGELDITKSLSLIGAGVGVTNITSTSTGDGIVVTGDNVSLKNFTYHGPTAGSYGIKVEPDSPVITDRLLNFDIENVTIDQGYRTGLDLNGVLGATIKNVHVSNIVNGNGMALTDSANVTITGSTTSNNAWGGLALYQTNKYYDQQVNNISVDGTNTFNDTIPVYTEDQSASQNFGSISLAGFNYVVQSPNNANDVYSWFQKTEQAAFDFATNAALSNNNVNVPTATVQGYSGSGAYGNNTFYVGTGSNAVALLIGNAVNQAASGGTINVSSGAYAEDVTAAKQLAFDFGDVTVNSLTLASGAAGSAVNGNLTAAGAIALNDAATVTGNLKAATFTSNATLAMTGNLTTSGATALNGASSITGNVAADSLTTGNTLSLAGNLSATNGVTLGGASTVKGNISAASLAANGALGLTGNLATSGASALNGASNITGNVVADTLSTGSTLTQVGNIAATNGVTLGGASTITGSVSAKTFTANGTLALNGGLTALGAAQFKGASIVNGNLQAASISASNSFGLTGNAIASGAIALNGANTLAGNLTGSSIALGATTLTGSTTLDTSAANGNIAVASVVGGGQALALKTGTGTASLGNVANAGSITALGAVTLTGTQYNAGAETFGATTLTGDTTFDAGTGNVVLASLAGGGHGVTIDAGNASVGNVANAGAVAVNGAATLTGSSYSGSSFAFGGPVTLTNGTTLGATGAVTLASLNGGGNNLAITSGTASLGNVANAGALSVTGPATLTGTSYVAGSIGLGATTLTGNTTLDTSVANGAISVASVDGTTAGGQSLGINAGTGNVSLGNLGATTRLGAVSDASKTTLAGSTYNANSFLFGGGVTLTSANTTLNTTQSASAAGGITFQGDLFGTTDGGQSLTLIAGPGTGAASANGDIVLQNVGTSSVYLGNLTVTGNNFTALTVDVGGNYNATLTGNQVFAADTLNVRGNANSTVGGDASGHIVSGGDVNIVANGNVSGTINGQNVNLTGGDVNSVVTASNAANIQGNTVGGSYTANAVTLIASNNVNAAVSATDFTLAAQHGSVGGTWTTIDTNGSAVVSVNGQTTVGLANVNPNKLVVEGFVLPAGTTIGANGQLILPQGVLLGLLSPGGGKPKMILVHTVQQLGELLAGGYSVIVIDLSNRDSGKTLQLASN